MGTLERIAFFRNRRDEVPNRELARDLAARKDAAGISEIADHLADRNRNVASDCLKVLYEIGYLDPSLIAPHVGAFLSLLDSRNNRMVWGAMIALACVAPIAPREVWKRIEAVIERTDGGTVITRVWGIRTMARVAAAKPAYARKLLPKLLGFLASSIPRDVPTHLESMRVLAGREGWDELLSMARSREASMSPSQRTRLRKAAKPE